MKAILKILRLREFLSFSREFFFIASQIRGVLLALVLLIGIGGWILTKVEATAFWDGQYLAFVTALTIGYGDFAPVEPLGKIICIALGVVGMIWVGLIVGVASVALKRSVQRAPTRKDESDD
tara:strand:- start:561 stop:926 length:366 start_codon:yes stop_codon:yes gene_type:complete